MHEANNCLKNQWLTDKHTYRHPYTGVIVINSATAELNNKSKPKGFKFKSNMFLYYTVLHYTIQKFMCYEQDSQIQSLKSLEWKNLECVTDFEYLSSWISTTSRDIASHKVKTWPALYELDNIWKSYLQRWLKMQFFRAVAESIMLYGAESWTIMKTHESQLDGMYKWMLHFALNVQCSQHVTN